MTKIHQDIKERPVQIMVNGRAAMTIMSSADDPRELVFGQLFTERVIESFSDIASIQVDGPQVSVITINPFGILLSRKTVLAGCGGASSFLDSGKLERIVGSLNISASQLSESVSKLPVTGWFSGGLFTADGDMISSNEDLTGQNVLDRLIGYGLSHEISLEGCYLAVFGNVSVETVRKAVIAKIPLMAVAGKVTDAARETAEDFGLELVVM